MAVGNALSPWAKGLDLAAKGSLLGGLVLMLFIGGKSPFLLFGVILFAILKSISEWVTAFSYPAGSHKRHFALVVAILVTSITLAAPFLWIVFVRTSAG